MNLVKIAREAKSIMKSDVVKLSGGFLSPHRLNQIEAGKGWRVRAFEKSVLSHILGVPEKTLFPEPGMSQRRPPAFPELPQASSGGIKRRPYKVKTVKSL